MTGMSRRDKSGDDASRRPAEPADSGFNNPFRDLAKRIGPLSSAPPQRPELPNVPAALRPPAPAPAIEDDISLFRAAVRGVVPLPHEQRGSGGAPAPHWPRALAAPTGEQAVLDELNDLVNGIAAFDVSDTDEHVEGMVVGLDPRILRRLRAGEFAYQAHLDLHGLTADEAKEAVTAFVRRAMAVGNRCVLLVHGRGRNSPDQRPVLKDGLKQWLTRGELGRRVLAFSSARPYDGGGGAMYVLLRRERRDKKPFRTFDGAKS